MQKLQKHRLILLLGILVALIFFYFGVNTWMESQQRKVSPPPVVRTKPPVQIKPSAKPVKPVEPKPAPKVPKPAVKPAPKPQPVAKKPPAPKPVPEPKKPEPEKEAKPVKKQTPKKVAKPEPKPQKVAQKPKPQKTKVSSKPVEKKPAKKTALRDYVVQVGAFKVRANAEKMLKLAKSKGYEVFLIEEDGLYKVRLRVRAEKLIQALRKVRADFKNAFAVLR